MKTILVIAFTLLTSLSLAQSEVEKENKNKLIRYSLNQLGTGRKPINKISPSIKPLKIDVLGKKVKE